MTILVFKSSKKRPTGEMVGELKDFYIYRPTNKSAFEHDGISLPHRKSYIKEDYNWVVRDKKTHEPLLHIHRTCIGSWHNFVFLRYEDTDLEQNRKLLTQLFEWKFRQNPSLTYIYFDHGEETSFVSTSVEEHNRLIQKYTNYLITKENCWGGWEEDDECFYKHNLHKLKLFTSTQFNTITHLQQGCFC